MSHVTTLFHGFTQQSGLNKLPKCTYHLLYSEQGANCKVLVYRSKYTTYGVIRLKYVLHCNSS